MELKARLPELAPVKNEGRHGFGCATICGLDHASGDAVVIVMADESDDCRDVARYWNRTEPGMGLCLRSRFMKGGAVMDYPKVNCC